MKLEIELKLAITKEQIPLLKDHVLLRDCYLETQQLETVYFDTQQADLAKRGFVLRIRVLAGKYIQTIKSSIHSNAGLYERQEWETEVSELLPNYHYFPDYDLRQELLETSLAERIKPLFTTQFKRTNWLVKPDAHNTVLVSLDEGYVIAGTKQEALTEVEFELLSGEKAILQQLADQLKQTISSLEPINLSKAKRGYNLMLGNSLPG